MKRSGDVDARIDAYLDHLTSERGLARRSIEAYGRDLAAFAETLEKRGVHRTDAIDADAVRAHLARLAKHGLSAKDVKVLIPHQANRRIIVAAAERLGLNCDQVIINIDRYGNTTAATIPLATRDAVEGGKVKKGDLVIFAAVGAGFTVGANLWRWEY